MIVLVDAHNEIRIGTRPSRLAVAQAQAVVDRLTTAAAAITNINAAATHPVLVKISATGDVSSSSSSSSGEGTTIQRVPMALQPSGAVDFTGALDDALINKQIDLAVHSLKDIPPDHRWKNHELFQIYCPLLREDPCDVLVGPYHSVQRIPPRARIGTSSIRRQAQLYSICGPDIQVIFIRGNVDARLQALQNGAVDALVLAKAGLKRLNLLDHWTCTDIPLDLMLPAVCQGIVTVVGCRDNPIVSQLWGAEMNHHSSAVAAAAERAFLDVVDQSSPWKGRPPLAGLMQYNARDKVWTFRGLLATPDGTKVLRKSTQTIIRENEPMTIEQSAAIGKQIGCELIEEAGAHFFD